METYYHDGDQDILIVSADIKLNEESAEQFLKGLEEHIDSGLRKIIVDCAGLKYISSFGIGILVRLHNRMDSCDDGDVKLSGLQESVSQVFEMTRLNTFLQIYPDVENARLSFTSSAAE